MSAGMRDGLACYPQEGCGERNCGNRMGCSVAVPVTVPSGLRAQEVEAGLLMDVQPDAGSCARWVETFPKSCTCPTA